MDHIKVVEFHSANWNIYPDLDADLVSGRTFREHFIDHDIDWEAANGENVKTADLLFFKGIIDLPPHPRRITGSLRSELMKRIRGKPFLTLIGEPREHCRLSYLFSNGQSTLCAAPGNDLDRIFVPAGWKEPHVDGWEERQDRYCWIGRPMPDRIRAARELIDSGVELDIYSKQPWPLPCWKGFVPDEHETAMNYKYRIVFENYPTHRYHSEKMFLSIRSGCITFYRGDPMMETPWAQGLYIPFSMENIVHHNFDKEEMLKRMDLFMHSDACRVYSYEHQIDKIIEKIHQRIGEGNIHANPLP